MKNLICAIAIFFLAFTPSVLAADPNQSLFAPSLEARVAALETAVTDLQGRMEDVEKIANRDYIEQVAKEVVLANIRVSSASGQSQTKQVSFAGLGTFEVKPGEVITHINGVQVGTAVHSHPYQSQPAQYYSTAGFDTRVVGSADRTRTVYIQRRPVLNRLFGRRSVAVSQSSDQAVQAYEQPASSGVCRIVNGMKICN